MTKVSQRTLPSVPYDYCFTLYADSRLLLERGEVVDCGADLTVFVTEPSQRVTLELDDDQVGALFDGELWDVREMFRVIKSVHMPPPARVIAQN